MHTRQGAATEVGQGLKAASDAHAWSRVTGARVAYRILARLYQAVRDHQRKAGIAAWAVWYLWFVRLSREQREAQVQAYLPYNRELFKARKKGTTYQPPGGGAPPPAPPSPPPAFTVTSGALRFTIARRTFVPVVASGRFKAQDVTELDFFTWSDFGRILVEVLKDGQWQQVRQDRSGRAQWAACTPDASLTWPPWHVCDGACAGADPDAPLLRQHGQVQPVDGPGQGLRGAPPHAHSRRAARPRCRPGRRRLN